jgi:putative membrane protein
VTVFTKKFYSGLSLANGETLVTLFQDYGHPTKPAMGTPCPLTESSSCLFTFLFRYMHLLYWHEYFNLFSANQLFTKKINMKKVIVGLSVITMIISACNNGPKDSVEKADSSNKANIDSPATKKDIVQTDQESSTFLVKAANGGMAEVQLGQLAQEKGINQKVKDFAGMMVHDHSAVNDQVRTLAGQRNVTLPDSVSDDNKKAMNDLAKKNGKDFDKAYINAMVKGHQEVLDMFKSAGDKVNDTEVKTFINNTIPKVQMHLDAAKDIQKTLK